MREDDYLYSIHIDDLKNVTTSLPTSSRPAKVDNSATEVPLIYPMLNDVMYKVGSGSNLAHRQDCSSRDLIY